MKFVTVTYGTEGDTRPLAALSRALIDAGHDARLLADAATLGSAAALDVPATAISGDIKAALGEALSGAVDRGGGFADTAKTLAHIANANAEAWMRETLEAAQGCDAVILGGLAAFVGLSVAEHLGIPAIGTGLIPITPTAEFPSPFLRPGLIPGWLNRTSHRLVNGLIWRAFRARLNAARTGTMGLAPRRRLWTNHPMLYGISPSLLPRPRDWPDSALVCGQWAIPATAWTPPPALDAFLAAGDPPLYVGFGSMAGLDRLGLLAALIPALGGRRALFYPGWSGVGSTDLPAHVLAIGDTPHDWLFPRVSMVVHHGGAGTSHSVARASVPSVVVPFAGDQFFWADCLRHAGVAPPWFAAKDLTASALGRGIALADDAALRSRAAALGAAMRTEDGLGRAVAEIERLATRPD
ncbi:MAG TPA: glycosyltransferase [Aliidongia sp.]|uniref:glycosyltransferase n=1 Tax=Aliidongia sp. TaxID=1914230 RepID=UPI002DDCBF6D|nr:glycosyltransferase [Aliidongia sp.]HEV2673876.1 glycosyltransferase [Aliidongia sp.]